MESIGILSNSRRLAARFPGAGVCFFGNTPQAKAYEVRGEHVIERQGHGRMRLEDPRALYFVNPGSVDGSRRSTDNLARYAVFDESSRSVSFYAVSYDDALAEQKARRAGYRVPRSTLMWRRCVRAAERVLRATINSAVVSRSHKARASR